MDININKSDVVKIGSSICEDANDFSNEIKKFLNTIENINVAWEGDDALKYINVLKDRYVTGLNELSDLIKEYGEYLKNVPEAYSLMDEAFASKNIDV